MISYLPLWNTLLNKGLKRTDLVINGLVSPSTLAKMGKNEYVSVQTIDKICDFLNCDIQDVIVHIQTTK